MAAKKKETKKRAHFDLEDQDIRAVLTQLNTEFGANTFILASDAEGVSLRFISTGIAALDFRMGGGIPENRISEVKGQFSALKSTIALTTTANFQTKYDNGVGVYVDAEKTFDPAYAKALGVDLERLIIINPDSGEQAHDGLVAIMGMNIPMFIVIDSIAALVPAAEIESSADQQFMGLHPRLINRLLRVLNARIKRSLYDMEAASTTVYMINQLREKVGVMFGNPETSPGGKGKDFFSSMTVRMGTSPSLAIKEDITVGGKVRKLRFGQKITFRIEKNKCGGSQSEEGEFIYYTRHYKGYEPRTFNNAEALFINGIFHEVISVTPQKKGVLYEYGEVAAKVEHAFVKKIREDEDLADILYREIMDKILEEEGIQRGIDAPELQVEEEEIVEEEEDTPPPKRRMKLRNKNATTKKKPSKKKTVTAE